MMVELNKTFEKLARSKSPVIVWGAGGYASKLCANTALSRCNILGFVDRNVNLHGKSMVDKNIHPVEWLKSREKCTLFVASSTYKEEITNELRAYFGWRGTII